MTQSEIENRVLAAFLEIAPDVDPSQLKRDAPFKDQIDFDSMDTLNFAVRLHKAFGIEIAESEYRELRSLSGAAALVTRKLSPDTH